MTTGRINQVTILPLGAEARRETPPRRGRTVHWEGSSTIWARELLGAASTAARPGARLHRFTTAIQLPPLSSPKDRPPHAYAGTGAPL